MKSIKKNNKGFTLLELIVTVALIISILAIAIVSFTKLSNNKKKESKEKVIDQIKTAGEQFLESNEAFIESSFKGGNEVKIPLKILVKEGLLNKVINPEDGKPFDECTVVKFTKESVSSKKISVSYEEEKLAGTDCIDTIELPEDNENPYCYIKSDGSEVNGKTYTTKPEVKIDFKDNVGGFGVDNSSGSCTINGTQKSCKIDDNKYVIPSENIKVGKNEIKVSFKDKAGNEGSCEAEFTYEEKYLAYSVKFSKADGKTYNPGEWSDKDVIATIIPGENSSTIKSKKYSLNGGNENEFTDNVTISNNGSNKIKFNITDNNNNSVSKEKENINIDKIKPTCSFEITGGAQDSSGVYTSKPTVKFKASDEGGSDIKSSTYSNDQTLTVNTGNNSFSATVRDNAGNERSCSASINYTIKEPNAEAYFLKDDNWNNQYSEDEGWTNSKIYAYLYKSYDSSDLTNKEYSLDGSSYKNIDESTQINGIIIPEGSHTITFRYKDASSNWKYTREYTIKSDYTKPSCSYAYSGGTQDSSGVYTSKPTIKFIASDTGGSGFNCSSSSYSGSCSGSSYSAYVGVTEGSNNLSSTVYDNAGNVASCSTSYTYNSKEPAINVKFYRVDNNDTYTLGKWINSNVKAVINPTSESSSIVKKEYNLNNSGYTAFNSDNVIISGEGTNTIKFRATDSAGKQIETNEYEIKIDKTPPTCSTPILKNDSNVQIIYDKNKWYNSNDKLNTISISAKDNENGSGISGTALYTDFVLESNVATNYQHSFQDLAGNKSTCSGSIKNDRTAPEAKISRDYDSTIFNFEANDNLGLSQYKYTYDSLVNSVGYNWAYQDVEIGNGKKSNDGTFTYNTNTTGTKMKATRGGKVTGFYDKVNNVENTSDKMDFIVKDIAGNESNIAKKGTYNACDSTTNKDSNGNIRRESVYHLQKVRGWGPQGEPLPNSNDPKHFSCEEEEVDNDGIIYFVAYYMIHSYQCECTKDININKLCSVNVPEITSINNDDGNHVKKALQLWPKLANGTYKSTTAQMMRIYYTNKTSCESKFENEKSKINQNVKYICNTGKDVENASGQSIPLHGYQWYYGSNVGHMDSFSNFGWYHTGGCYDYGRNLGGREEEVYNKYISGWSKSGVGKKYVMEQYWQDNNDVNEDYMKKQCEIACKKNVGQINYTKNSDGTTNYKVCTDSGNATEYNFDDAHVK